MEPETVPTWADLQREALYCPVLQQMATRVERGDLTREEALRCTVLWLSRDRRAAIERDIARLSLEMPVAWHPQRARIILW